jgi:hypothetical protein
MTVSLLNGYGFSDAEAPESATDTIPEVDHIEFPCRICNKEAGPYGGRGRKPTLCADCKPKGKRSDGVRVTGNAHNLAAQAAKVLANLNTMMAMGAAMASMFRTSGAIAQYNAEMFEQQAYQALLLDPELCRQILKTGGKSAGVSLFMAYIGMGVAIGPTAYEEYRDKQAEKRVRMEESAAG